MDTGLTTTNRYLIAALGIALLLHGTTMFFTLESTYDALIHLFFASHYSEHWFDAWSQKWYTGFSVLGYPPLVHQLLGASSLLVGLKGALFLLTIVVVVLFVTGVYRFALLITKSKSAAGYAAILAVFSSAFIEALHIFGQLPTLFGISLLLHALPYVHRWVYSGSVKQLLCAVAIVAVTVCSHHVTPIFGMIFFIFPIIGTALFDHAQTEIASQQKVHLKGFIDSFRKRFWAIVLFGAYSLLTIVFCILPYWINSKNNPITQIPIPHGSRDHFLEVGSSGLVFFLIPWGILLLLMPYLFYRFFSKRLLFFGLSFTLLFILGTGGTTAIPRLMLGETAFNILTLDRFTFWGSIMALPIAGEFMYRLVEGDYGHHIRQLLNRYYHQFSVGILSGLFLLVAILTLTLGYFRPLQPDKIDVLPIVNFLNQDEHHQWRYLPLGFGDQMAWLSSQTNALTVDGNYHSARRLPELTTRAVERLENAKYRGVEGLGSLQQFLTVPEKFHLKYVFSNDKFYDPLLYFAGWQRLDRLENGITVWERLGIPPLPTTLYQDATPRWQRLMWGIIPMCSLIICIMILLGTRHKPDASHLITPARPTIRALTLTHGWAFALSLGIAIALLIGVKQNQPHSTVATVLLAYHDALDYKEFEQAYGYLNPQASKSLDQFMLEVSVTDGLTSSYAKMDSIEIEILEQGENSARAIAHTTYITPLKTIRSSRIWNLSRFDSRWFIEPHEIAADLPPRKFVQDPTVAYHLQGRRKTSTESTDLADVLRQPTVRLLDAKLVQRDSQYCIVGRIRNEDQMPADVALDGLLYDRDNRLVAKYGCRDVMKHKLLPWESTGFRIDFEKLAWIASEDQYSENFDPEFFHANFIDEPSSFTIQIRSNITSQDLDKNLALSKSSHRDDHIEAVLFNAGSDEVTIPQVIVSHYSESDQLAWVEAHYLDQGIRQHRKMHASIRLSTIETTAVQAKFSGWSLNGKLGGKLVPGAAQVDPKLLSESRSFFIELNSYQADP